MTIIVLSKNENDIKTFVNIYKISSDVREANNNKDMLNLVQ